MPPISVLKLFLLYIRRIVFLFFDFVVGHLIWFFFIQFSFASEGSAAAVKSVGRGAAPLCFFQRSFNIFLLVRWMFLYVSLLVFLISCRRINIVASRWNGGGTSAGIGGAAK